LQLRKFYCGTVFRGLSQSPDQRQRHGRQLRQTIPIAESGTMSANAFPPFDASA
jgi:hypothetical protein